MKGRVSRRVGTAKSNNRARIISIAMARDEIKKTTDWNGEFVEVFIAVEVPVVVRVDLHDFVSLRACCLLPHSHSERWGGFVHGICRKEKHKGVSGCGAGEDWRMHGNKWVPKHYKILSKRKEGGLWPTWKIGDWMSERMSGTNVAKIILIMQFWKVIIKIMQFYKVFIKMIRCYILFPPPTLPFFLLHESPIHS